MEIKELKEQLYALQKKMAAYSHALGLLSYDGETTAPSATVENREVTMAILNEESYKLTTSKKTIELLEELDRRKEELNEQEKRMVYLLLKNQRDMQKVPMDEYIAFQSLLVQSGAVWHEAKEKNDWKIFEPYLEQIFTTIKKFAGYLDPSKDPYDYWLNEFEDGTSRAMLDEFFEKLRSHIVPLLKKIESKPQVDDSMRYGHFDVHKQEELSEYLMELEGLDLSHVGISTTEHPFTTSLGSHLDERITTHYQENDFASSMFSVIHEGGHALYDTGSRKEYAFTVLDGGVSMGIHESQSRFYENIIGRSKEFCEYVFPKLKELFPEHMDKYTANDFYLAMNKAEPSLIRTEADELTYALHIMVRYEIEKKVMAGEMKVSEIPCEWNRLYKEYLGVDVPNDKEGCLQDTHWSGGAIGYFPSYALGSAYGAQFLSKMKESVDVDKCVKEGNFKPINDWNKEHIWQFGCLYKPGELFEKAAGDKFNADYFIKYLEDKYTEIYKL